MGTYNTTQQQKQLDAFLTESRKVVGLLKMAGKTYYYYWYFILLQLTTTTRMAAAAADIYTRPTKGTRGWRGGGERNVHNGTGVRRSLCALIQEEEEEDPGASSFYGSVSSAF